MPLGWESREVLLVFTKQLFVCLFYGSRLFSHVGSSQANICQPTVNQLQLNAHNSLQLINKSRLATNAIIRIAFISIYGIATASSVFAVPHSGLFALFTAIT